MGDEPLAWLAAVGLVVFAFALVNLIYPFRPIRTRLRAAGVMLVAFVFVAVTGAPSENKQTWEATVVPAADAGAAAWTDSLGSWGVVLLVVFAIFLMFRRKSQTADATNSPPLLEGAGDFDTRVVGTGSRQDALSEIVGGKTEDGHEFETVALLVFDDQNEYDDQAVAVKIDGRLVGYLSKGKARQFRSRVKGLKLKDRQFLCDAMIVGGWDLVGGDAGHFGVRLDFEW